MEARGEGMKLVGGLTAALGLAVGVAALFVDTSVESYSSGSFGLPERVTNLAKLQLQDMMMAWAAMLFVGGCVLHVGGALLDVVSRGRLPVASPADATVGAARPASDAPAVSTPTQQLPAADGSEERTIAIAAGVIVVILVVIAIAMGASN